MRCAAGAWREQSRADFEFVYAGTTALQEVDLQDGVNAISWVDADGAGALAATFYHGDEGAFASFDVVFYASTDDEPLRWSGLGEPAEGTIDIAGILTHELGHALGLGHFSDPEATMYLAARRRGLIHRSLHSTDRECIESLYGVRMAEPPAVVVRDATPAAGPTAGGFEVVIDGSNFTFPAESRLFVGSLELSPAVWEVETCGRIRVLDMPAHGPGSVGLRLLNAVGEGTAADAFRYEGPPVTFKRGDANDDGRVDLSDALAILGVLFLGEAGEFRCGGSADVNDSGKADVSDAVAVLGHLFLGSDPPRPPFPDCGQDPTPDALSCARFTHCP
jgi:hypothetical protein